jgi:hypothetical protein
MTSEATARGGQYLDLLEHAQPPIGAESRLAARFATMKSVHDALMGRVSRRHDGAARRHRRLGL